MACRKASLSLDHDAGFRMLVKRNRRAARCAAPDLVDELLEVALGVGRVAETTTCPLSLTPK